MSIMEIFAVLKSWEPYIMYIGMPKSLTFFIISTAFFTGASWGIFTSKKSPVITIKSTCSFIEINIDSSNACKFKSLSFGFLQDPR